MDFRSPPCGALTKWMETDQCEGFLLTQKTSVMRQPTERLALPAPANDPVSDGHTDP